MKNTKLIAGFSFVAVVALFVSLGVWNSDESNSKVVPSQTIIKNLGAIRPELKNQLPEDWTAEGYLKQNIGLSNLFKRERPKGWTDADVLANHYIKWGKAAVLQYKPMPPR